MSVRFTPFQYRDFYDIPHAILLEYRGKVWLLDNPFDSDLDEYPPDFQVYVMPDPVRRHLEPVPADQVEGESWYELPSQGLLLGAIPRNALRFDPSLRKCLDARVLDTFVEELLQRDEQQSHG